MDSKLGQLLLAFIIVVVTLVWAASFVAPLFNASAHPDPQVQVAMMAVVGFAIQQFTRQRSKAKENGEPKPQPPPLPPLTPQADE